MSQYNHNDDNFIYCIGTYFDKATMVSFFRFISKSDKSTEEKWVPMNYLYKNIYFKEAVETYLSNIVFVAHSHEVTHTAWCPPALRWAA